MRSPVCVSADCGAMERQLLFTLPVVQQPRSQQGEGENQHGGGAFSSRIGKLSKPPLESLRCRSSVEDVHRMEPRSSVVARQVSVPVYIRDIVPSMRVCVGSSYFLTYLRTSFGLPRCTHHFSGWGKLCCRKHLCVRFLPRLGPVYTIVTGVFPPPRGS